MNNGIQRGAFGFFTKVKGNWPIIMVLAVCIVGALIFYVFAYRYYGTFFHGYDAQEYYSQLRSAVIDGDLDYTNEFMELIPNRQRVFYDADGNFKVALTPDGRPMNMATSGWAIVTLVPFLVAHLIAYLGGFLTDGYSTPYDILCTFWHVLIVIGGLSVLIMTMRQLTNDIAASVATIAGFFATNLCYYTAVYPMMNHAASFGTVSLLVFLAYRLHLEPTQRRLWVWAGITGMLLVLLRPPNAVLLVVLVPAMWTLYRMTGVQKKWQLLCFASLAVIIGVMAAVAIQSIIWRLSYGYWIVSSYSEAGEGFNWFKPHLWQILLSPKQGAWYLHPVYMIGAIGLVIAVLSRNSPYRHLWIAITIAALLHLYVNASWLRWTSGHSFGNRRFVDVAPLMLFGVGFLIYRFNRGWKLVGGIAVIVLLCLWNLGLLAGTILGFLPVEPVDLLPQDLLSAQWQTLIYLFGR